MASTRTRANTAVQTRPEFVESRILLLSPTTTPPYGYRDTQSPPFAGARQHADITVDLTLPNTPRGPYTEAQALIDSHLSNVLVQKLEKERENNETHAMFASPTTTNWHGSAPDQATPNVQHRGMTFEESTASSPDLSSKPSRHDSAYFSVKDREDGPELDSEVQARQMRARERVVILRAKVLRTRRIRKEKKGQLRQQRDRARDALDRLTRKINELVALGRLEHLHAELSPYYDELRTAQDELGPAEDAYDNLENRLDEEEQDLEEEEEHFYRYNDVLSHNIPLEVGESKLNDVLSPLVRPYHPPDTEFEEISLENQKVQEYLAKIEEADRLKEGLDDLETDYYRLSVDATFRKRHGIPLSAETIDFLRSYPEEYKESLDNLHRVEDELLDLRDDCIDQGLFNESEYRYESRDALCEEVMDAVDEARERSPLRVAADRHRQEEIDFGDKRDYVNKWLLEWVPDSTVDKMMLQSCIYYEFPESHHENLNDDKWADLAIENWDKDSAGELANVYYNASRLDAISGDPAGTGNLGAISTTRSNIYGSAVSLDVVLDEECSSEGPRTDDGTSTTQLDKLPLTPAIQTEPPASTDTTPKPSPSRQPPFFISHPVVKAASLNAFDMSPETSRRTLELSIDPPKRARSALPDYRARLPPTPPSPPAAPQAIPRKVSFFEPECTSTVRNDTSSVVDSLLSNGQCFVAAPATSDHEVTDTLFPHSSNATILSDLLIPLDDVLL